MILIRRKRVSEKRYNLTEEKLKTILKNDDVSSISIEDIENIVSAEPGIPDNKPEPYYHVDPRDGIKIVYNASRSARPHDNERPPESAVGGEDLNKEANFITKGETTGVIDVADLSEGFTFINFNLFPAFFPQAGGQAPGKDGRLYGMHFLQWTSSYQDRDWHNMPVDDCTIVMQRIAALEKTLLARDDGYVTIFKNCGRLVGGSIAQGHQQMGYSNIKPRHVEQLEQFQEQRGSVFSQFMLENNPSSLLLKDYGKVVFIVPYCMRRPYNMMLIVKDTSKQHLYELDEQELRQVALGWKTGIRIMRSMLAFLGKSIAYNIVAHNGPGAGIFFDFMPYTQETGGFEHLGIFICQNTPELCFSNIQSYCKEYLEGGE
jgi:hypothetical protein